MDEQKVDREHDDIVRQGDRVRRERCRGPEVFPADGLHRGRFTGIIPVFVYDSLHLFLPERKKALRALNPEIVRPGAEIRQKFAAVAVRGHRKPEEAIFFIFFSFLVLKYYKLGVIFNI